MEGNGLPRRSAMLKLVPNFLMYLDSLCIVQLQVDGIGKRLANGIGSLVDIRLPSGCYATRRKCHHSSRQMPRGPLCITLNDGQP